MHLKHGDFKIEICPSLILLKIDPVKLLEKERYARMSHNVEHALQEPQKQNGNRGWDFGLREIEVKSPNFHSKPQKMLWKNKMIKVSHKISKN